MRPSLIAAGLSLNALVLAAPALAGGAADPRAVWDLYARNCQAIVEAEDPARQAAEQHPGAGSVAATVDGRIAGATMTFDEPPGETRNMALQVMVNRFERGRTVVCMLHMFQPDPALAQLFEIARDNASALSGDLENAAGGSFQPTAESSDATSGDLAQARFTRLSNDRFPPSAVLTVQVLPTLVALTYFVVQADRN